MKKEFKKKQSKIPRLLQLLRMMKGLKKCLTSESRVIFILYGDICNIPDIVETVKSSGKIAMVHIDLIAGLSSKEIAVDFIQKYTKADGIITTKPALIKRAKELDCIQSFGCLSLIPWLIPTLNTSFEPPNLT